MKMLRTIRITGLLYLTCLAASTNAHFIQTQNENSPAGIEKSLNQPVFGDSFSNIDWSSIDVKQDHSVQLRPIINSTIDLPKLALQPEFQSLSPKNSFINTDPSKRFTAPEPSAWIMMLVGLLGLILVRRKNRD